MTQNYAMIYYDKHCSTLNEGLRILRSISNPILCYRQQILSANPSRDSTYKPYFHNDSDNEIITLSFPSEYTWIANIRNTQHCKMVFYYKDVEHSYIKEILITPSTNIKIIPGTKIIIYTRGKSNIDISFDVYLMKINQPITSKL